MMISKVLLKDLIANHLTRENGLNEVLEFTLNAMMNHERSLHLEHADANKANGYRPGRVYGHGKLLELRIPHDRNGEFFRRCWLCFAASRPRPTSWSVPCMDRGSRKAR
jgi:transposase-like protein